MIVRFEGEHAPLSNFSAAEVEMYGDVYRWLEAAFQAAKWPPVVGDLPHSTVNAHMRDRIRRAPSPGVAKGLGQTRLPRMRHDWDVFRLEAMLLLVRRKFGVERMASPTATAAARLRGAYLLGTGTETLVEGNGHRDDFWGAVWVPAGATAGRRVWATDAVGSHALVGENRHGLTLMQVRGELR